MGAPSLRLSQVDPHQAAVAVATRVYARMRRDLARFGGDITKVQMVVLKESGPYRSARVCADFLINPAGTELEKVEAAFRRLRADVAGTEPGDPVSVPPDAGSLDGLLLAATAARLAILHGRTTDATEVAVLASVDERTIRNAVKDGKLTPVTSGRPMRFEADQVRRFLYERGVPGFKAPAGASAPAQPGGVVRGT